MFLSFLSKLLLSILTFTLYLWSLVDDNKLSHITYRVTQRKCVKSCFKEADTALLGSISRLMQQLTHAPH